MDSKVIKSYQCSLEDLMLYLLKLILNSDKALALNKQKKILTGLLITKVYKKVYKNLTMKIFLFNYSMFGYI